MRHSISCNAVSKHFDDRFVGWGGIPLKPKCFSLGSRHHKVEDKARFQMDLIIAIHRVFGQMVLPLLIVVAAIWFTVTWKPDTPPTTVARLFPVLVDLQVTLGLIYFVYRL